MLYSRKTKLCHLERSLSHVFVMFCGMWMVTKLCLLRVPYRYQAYFSDSLITICHKCRSIANEEQLTYRLINSIALFKIFATILQRTYWDRQQWKELKLPVTELCKSVARCVEYLSKKNKKTKVNHHSPTPIREVVDNLRLKFLPKADCSIPEQLWPIDTFL